MFEVFNVLWNNALELLFSLLVAALIDYKRELILSGLLALLVRAGVLQNIKKFIRID
jgi:hypothetical protein